MSEFVTILLRVVFVNITPLHQTQRSSIQQKESPTLVLYTLTVNLNILVSAFLAGIQWFVFFSKLETTHIDIMADVQAEWQTAKHAPHEKLALHQQINNC